MIPARSPLEGDISQNYKRRRSLSPTSTWEDANEPNVPNYANDTRYDIPEDEIVESDDLDVSGETIAESSSDDAPVRILTDFSVYEWHTRHLVNVAELLGLDSELEDTIVFGASGLVFPYAGEDDDNAEMDQDETGTDASSELHDAEPSRVKLSPILEFNVHFISSSPEPLHIDPKMYLRTAYAWYILDRPADSYYIYFVDYWIKHRLLHLVIHTSLQDRTVDLKQFIGLLHITPESPDSVACAYRFLCRELKQQDLECDDVKAYIQSTLEDVYGQSSRLRRALSHVPLVASLWGVDAQAKKKAKKCVRKAEKTGPLKRLKDIEKEVLQHRNKTVVTPIVARIASGLFKQSLRITGKSLEANENGSTESTPDGTRLTHQTDPSLIEWVDRIAPNHYRTVRLDGVLYSIGDPVIVEMGEDHNATRERNAASSSARSRNRLANQKWFCEICYMFEKFENGRGRKYFHGRWLQHGSQTLLQETAHANGLFYLDECDDLPLECIYSHCNLQILRGDEVEPVDEPGERFHTWLTWDPDACSLKNVHEDALSSTLQACKPWKRCYSCGLRSERKKQCAWTLLPDGGISRHNVNYHVNDCVYLSTSHLQARPLLYEIGQIVGFRRDDQGHVCKIKVRRFGRYDLVPGSSDEPRIGDDRRLFLTADTVNVVPEDIEGKAFITYATGRRREDWLRHEDHFYVDCASESIEIATTDELQPLSSIPRCEPCWKERRAELDTAHRLLTARGPLRGLELFAGAGGLSTGLELAGFMQTQWAVEFSPSAALTFQRNHPEAVVYNQDTNLLLKHAIETAEGREPQPLAGLNSRSKARPLPPMPAPGEVDFIFGGPPCQSFSLMNHHRSADDIRNTLVCNMLSYVEFYRPMYFLLENVIGLLSFPLHGEQSGRKVINGIKMGVVKFIVRALVCLGYQVHFKVLQAGQYGAPQSRRRVIFWGAKRGLPLPKFPVPLHSFPKSMHMFKLPTGDVLYPVTRAVTNDGDSTGDPYRQLAPLLPVTVDDAISDLPAFDWVNPSQILHATLQEIKEIKNRWADSIPSFDAVTSKDDDLPGFNKPEHYAYLPLSRYQTWIRRNGASKVDHHYTRRFPPSTVERVCNVPMWPTREHPDKQYPDHLALPKKLRLKRCYGSDGLPLPHYRGIYGRVNGRGYFLTAMTTVSPSSKGGRLLHPTQKRIVSVRECARAQGFPDFYQFLSVNERLPDKVADQYRQIGNAVPVPLALALGRELGKALVEYWLSQEQIEQGARSESPEV